MREVFYKYSTLGKYYTEDSGVFQTDDRLQIVVEPHDFSIAIGNEILRKNSSQGYRIAVSRQGEVILRDWEGNELCSVSGQNQNFTEVRFHWRQSDISVQFGKTVTVDNYPNCDGEHDRWSEEWQVEYEVKFDEETKKAKIAIV